MRSQTGARFKALLPVLCALAFLAPRGRAQTLVEVTNTASDNTTPGSLGAVLTAATPNTLIIFAPFLSPVVAPVASYTNAIPLTLDANQETVNFTGGMSVNSGGFLNLNGLTASGITVNAGGTLSTSFSSIIGLTLNNGGIYQTRDNSFTSGITLSGTGGTIDPNGNNPTMSGITGTGGLTVADSSLGGLGIVTLTNVDATGVLGSAPNNYTGATSVTAGTLQLGASGALPAGTTLNTTGAGIFDLNGFIQTLATVNNLGTIKTGLGTLVVTGNYTDTTGAGTLSVALQSGLTNLQVNGTAALNGEKLAVTGHPALGMYTVVTAGALSGTFTQGSLPFGVTDSITCSGLLGTCLVDILSDTPFTLPGQSANQASIGNALNLASYSASGDLLSVINQLGALPAAQQNAALDQIGPISYAALSGMSFAGAGVQSAAVTQRLTGLQASRENTDGARFASFNAGGSYPGTLVAELPGDASAAYTDRDRLFDPGSRWGFFVAGLGTFDRLDPINGNSGAQPGYSVNATGETLGADYRFNDHFAAGVSAGYVNSFAVISGVGGTVYGQSARFGTYATVYNDAFHGNLSLGGAHDFYDTSRGIPAFSRVATANPSGQEFNMDVMGGWDVKTEHTVVSPFLGLAYDRMMLGSFTESGAGALDLAVSPQTAQSLRSSLGAKVSRQYKTDWADFTPYASAGWQHEFENQSRALGAQLASGGTAFTVMTADVARESALLGAGVNMDWTPGFSTRLAYESTLSFDFRANTFDGSLRWRF